MVNSNGDVDKRALELFSRSLDISSGERVLWIRAEAGEDTELADRALKLLSVDEDASVALRTGGAYNDTLEDGPPPEQIGAYRITDLIGRGGMGAVYRGERASGDFDHDVAIKIVRPGVLSDKLIARFALERQTLAQLSHPNIARLYDGGALETGAPYIVMEYIDGLPITEWADDNDLSKEARLGLFQSACSAVGHAHQNLIIHRDITPSNVLVDKLGEVKLIDFGISKPYDEAADASEAGGSLASLSFTPGFAAPERSQGASANTLSDVFSLGKLLEALLPRGMEDEELTAISTKAAAIAPEDRYDSVGDLSEDVANYLSGFPVQAVSATRGYKFRKFLSRHTLGVSLSALALAGLIGAFGVTLFQYQRAETARIQADSRFSETRELTSFLLNDLGEDLSELPGTLPLQKRVAETSARYLNILADAAKADPSLDLEHAQGRKQLGNLLTQSGGRNLGDPEEGLRQFEISIDILTRLAAEPDASLETKKLLADEILNRSYVHEFYFGDTSMIPEATAQAVPIYNEYLEANPDSMEVKAALLDIRLQHWGLKAEARGYAEVDEEILSIKRDVEALFADDLTNDDYIINYGSFLYLVAAHITSKWNGTVEIVPTTDREEYETMLEWARTGFLLTKQRMEENPANPEDIYTYSWALEPLVAVATIGAEWRPNLTDIDTRLAPYGDARLAIAAAQQKRPEFVESVKLANELNGYIDTLDTLIERLKPFDEGTYSYIQLIYAANKNRAYVQGGLMFDLDAAEQSVTQAYAIPDVFLLTEPNNLIVTTEAISLRFQKVMMLMRREVIYKQNDKAIICEALAEIQDLLSTSIPERAEMGTVVQTRMQALQLQGMNKCL